MKNLKGFSPEEIKQFFENQKAQAAAQREKIFGQTDSKDQVIVERNGRTVIIDQRRYSKRRNNGDDFAAGSVRGRR